MTVQTVDSYGSPSLRIETESGTWVYELAAGGFSSLIDPDRAEWIGFAPGAPVAPDGAANVFRGIPNLVYPDNIGHAGYRHCISEWEERSETVELTTRSLDGKWEWSWTVREDGASMEMLQTPPNRTFWFLYEGTPGGVFDPSTAVWGTDPGGRASSIPGYDKCAAGAWKRAWFGDRSSAWVLELSHLTARGEPSLAGWMASDEQGSNGMVVFGFGRSHDNGANAHLTGVQRFHVRLVRADHIEPQSPV